eukprot:3221893-Rhodomonas_salina.1
MFAPVTVTWAFPGVGVFQLRVFIATASYVMDSIRLPICMPAVKVLMIVPPTPAAIIHCTVDVEFHTVASLDVKNRELME